MKAGVLSFLILLSFIPASAEAQTCQATVSPRRISAAPGETITVRVTPKNVLPGPAGVSFKVCTSVASRGVRASDDQPYVISSADGGFAPVELTLKIDEHAPAGDVAIPLIAEPLAEGQEPGSGTAPVRLENAFVVTVSGGNAGGGDFLFNIGRNRDVGEVGGVATVTVNAPGRVTIPLVVLPKDGFQGTVSIAKSVTDPGTYVVTKECPVEGGADCMFETLAVEVAGSGAAFESVIVSPAPTANNGQVIFTATAEGHAPKQAVLNVRINRSAPPAPPGFSVKAPKVVDVTAGDDFELSLAFEGTNGWGGPVDVKAYPPPSIQIESPAFTLNTGEESQLRGHVAADAPADVTLNLQAQSTVGGQLLMKQVAIKLRIARAAAGDGPGIDPNLPCDTARGSGCYSVEFEPGSLPIDAGSSGSVTAVLTRSPNGPATVYVNPHPHLGDARITFAPLQFNAGETRKEIALNVKRGAEAGSVRYYVEAFAPDLSRPSVRGSGRQDKFIDVDIPGTTATAPAGKGFSLTVHPDNITLQPGQEQTIELQIARDPGFTNGVALRWEGQDPRVPLRTDYAQSVFQFSDSAPRKITLKAANDAAPGQFEMIVRGTPSGEAASPDDPSSALSITVDERPASASVRVEPDSFELLPGEERSVQVFVEGKNGWNGTVDVTAKGSNGTSASEESFTIDTPGPHEIVVRATPGAEPNRYAYVKIKVFPHGKSNLISETNIRSEVRGIAAEFTAEAEPKLVHLKPGESAQVAVSFTEGQNGWRGPLDVSISRTDGIQVVEQRFRIDSLPVRKTITVRALPEVPTDRPLDSLIVKATPPGGSEREVAYIGLDIESPAPEPVQPAFTVNVLDTLFIDPGERPGVQFDVAGENEWAGRVRITARTHQYLTVDPSSFELDANDPGNFETVHVTTVPGLAAWGRNRIPDLVFDAQPVGGGQAKSVSIAVKASSTHPGAGRPGKPRIGGDRPNPRDPDGGGPDGGIPDDPDDFPEPALPLPPMGDGLFGAEMITNAVRIVEASGVHVEGVRETQETLAEMYENQEQANLLVGFSTAHELLLQQLQNSAPSPIGAMESIDPVRFARMMDDASARERDGELGRPLYQTASAGLLPIYFMWDNVASAEYKDAVLDIKAGRSIEWRKLSPIEMLVQQMQAGQANRQIATMTSIAEETVSEMNDRLGKMQADKLPIPQLKAIVAGLAVTGAAAAVADMSAKASCALFPTHVVDLYSVVNGEQHLPGTANPTVPKDGSVSLQVYVTAASDTKDIATPWDIATKIAYPLFTSFGGKMKGGKGQDGEPGQPKTPGKGDREPGGKGDTKADDPRIERAWQSKENLAEFVHEELKKLLVGIPILNDWVTKLNPQFKIKGYKTRPILVDSEGVLHLGYPEDQPKPSVNPDIRFAVNSKELIRIREDGPGQYAIEGKNVGHDAGYFFGLKGWLIKRLPADKGKMNRVGVVDVVDDEPRPSNPCAPTKPPATFGQACRYNDAGGLEIAPAGYTGGGYPGIIICDGTCAFPH
ncbi:MAG: hypothetical protein HYU52_06345 [Acidobacteria bacterium]|nr:hypothetical protein [Acidobacteriota bacterium]